MCEVMKNVKAFCSPRFTLGQGEGGGVGRCLLGGRLRTSGNLSIAIASLLLLHTVHSPVTALQMEAVIINHHSHTQDSGTGSREKRLHRASIGAVLQRSAIPERWRDRIQDYPSTWTRRSTLIDRTDHLDFPDIRSRGGNIYRCL